MEFNAELLAQFSAGSRCYILRVSQDASRADTMGASSGRVMCGHGKPAEWWCHNYGVPPPQEQAASIPQAQRAVLQLRPPWELLALVCMCCQSCPAEVGRCHLPWRNMLLSREQEHNYLWKHFIFSLSFIIPLVHVTVTQVLFPLPQVLAAETTQFFVYCMVSLFEGLLLRWGLTLARASSQPNTILPREVG